MRIYMATLTKRKFMNDSISIMNRKVPRTHTGSSVKNTSGGCKLITWSVQGQPSRVPKNAALNCFIKFILHQVVMFLLIAQFPDYVLFLGIHVSSSVSTYCD